MRSIKLMYYGARWSALGRWAQPDSIIPANQGVQGWDRFAYVNNSPVRYTDPSGHKITCDADENCNQSQHLSRFSGDNYWKAIIKYDYGIKMADSKEMKWSRNNLMTAYNSLKMINDKLHGNLNTMVSGTTFTIMGGGNQYYGETKSTGVDFHVASSSTKIPSINFLHETGHLLDNVPATEDVFSDQVSATPTWVKVGYVDKGILGRKFTEPVQAIPMNEPYQSGEYWADAFANYVADNINMSTPAGQDMYDFVTAALAPYIGQ